LVIRRQQLRRDLAGARIERDPEQVSLARIIGGGDVVEPAGRRVDGLDAQDVDAGRAERTLVRTAAVDPVGAPPAVALAYPRERLAWLDPVKIVAHVNPGLILFVEQLVDLAGARLDAHHVVVVLLSVQPLHDELSRR